MLYSFLASSSTKCVELEAKMPNIWPASCGNWCPRTRLHCIPRHAQTKMLRKCSVHSWKKQGSKRSNRPTSSGNNYMYSKHLGTRSFYSNLTSIIIHVWNDLASGCPFIGSILPSTGSDSLMTSLMVARALPSHVLQCLHGCFLAMRILPTSSVGLRLFWCTLHPITICCAGKLL
jgi:hypothetical protein